VNIKTDKKKKLQLPFNQLLLCVCHLNGLKNNNSRDSQCVNFFLYAIILDKNVSLIEAHLPW